MTNHHPIRISLGLTGKEKLTTDPFSGSTTLAQNTVVVDTQAPQEPAIAINTDGAGLTGEPNNIISNGLKLTLNSAESGATITYNIESSSNTENKITQDNAR